MLREFHTHFLMGTACDLRNFVVLGQAGKYLLDQKERPDVATFQELGSRMSLHGQEFLT
jgi:hypothetical protein